MGQFVGCLKGHFGSLQRARTSRSCRATSRSTTKPTAAASCRRLDRRRRPARRFHQIATLAFKAAGEAILLIGDTQGWLGQSVYLRDVCGREEGAPPPVDLAAEKRNGDVVRGMIHAGTATAVHDISDGGLADRTGRDGDCKRHRRALLGGAGLDRAARLLVRRRPGALHRDGACRPDAGLVLAKMKGAGVPCARIGTTAAMRSRWPGEGSGCGRRRSKRVRKLAAGLYGGKAS
jgi:phosphoribosylformylglycinamidine synthase